MHRSWSFSQNHTLWHFSQSQDLQNQYWACLSSIKCSFHALSNYIWQNLNFQTFWKKVWHSDLLSIILDTQIKRLTGQPIKVYCETKKSQIWCIVGLQKGQNVSHNASIFPFSSPIFALDLWHFAFRDKPYLGQQEGEEATHSQLPLITLLPDYGAKGAPSISCSRATLYPFMSTKRINLKLASLLITTFFEFCTRPISAWVHILPKMESAKFLA